MVLKIWSLGIISLLIMLFSGVVCGQNVIGEGGKTIDGIFYGEGCEVGAKDNNLLIGGIGQIGDPALPPGSFLLVELNPEYKKFANNNKAIYIPTYYSGDGTGDAVALVEDAANVDLAATSQPTDLNGLNSWVLKSQEYDTIIAYSGGTASAVTALDKQGVTCKTLILISPMKGTLSKSEYDLTIQRILKNRVDIIVVLQSEKDKPFASGIPLNYDFSGYQAKFTKGANPDITVREVPLTKTGNDGHIEMFFTYAMDNIKNGVYVDPQGQDKRTASAGSSGMDSNPPTVQAFQVTPLSLIASESFTIDYTVSDSGGSGLKQVELWRKDEQSDWQEIKRNKLSDANGPISGSFTDSPSAPGKYWYGLHMVDNADNWNDERNSNTKNPSVGFEFIEVEVKSSEEKIRGASEEIRTLEGHTESVNSVAFSPDSSILASGSSDKTVKLWDVETSTEIRTLEGHPNRVSSVAFSPDGSILASCGYDNTIKLWDVQTGTEIKTIEGNSWYEDSVAFSPDGSILASGGSNPKIQLWDVQTGTEIKTLEDHSEWVRSIAFSPDGSILASGGDFSFFNGWIQLWDVQTGTEIHKLQSNPRFVFSIAFSPDGRTLASGGYDGKVKLCDVSTGNEIRTLEGLFGYVRGVAFSPDGSILATRDDDGVIKLWDVETGTEIQKLEGNGRYESSIAFSPDGRTLASGSGDSILLRSMT